MTYALEILSAADDEHAETISWLVEHTSVERAAMYSRAISSALDEIRELPLAWRQWKSFPAVRARHLRDVSHSIIYRVRDRVVLVVAFAHMKRMPGYWLDRLR